MKTLFDQGTPVPLRHLLADRQIATAHELGWSELSNGEFLSAAVAAGFEVIVTTDKNIRHQQSLAGFESAIVVLPTTNWVAIRRHSTKVAEAVAAALPGTLVEITFDS